MKSHRLEPRMPVGMHTVLLGDLALEQMRLRAFGAHRTKAFGVQRRPADSQLSDSVVGEHGIQIDSIGPRRIVTEQRGDSLAFIDAVQNHAAKIQK